MIHYPLAHPLKILFIGINPHPGSYRRGVPFSNNKTFWYLLKNAGLLNESLSALKNDAALLSVYTYRFGPVYHYGLLNISDRPTDKACELKPGEEYAGAMRILDAIATYQPKVVCFIGKITYQKFMKIKRCNYGWQPPLASSQLYVMHFPLRGHAYVRIQELREVHAIAH